MPVTNIITPTECKTFAAANSELDISTIKDWMIRKAQDEHLRSLLGDDMYYDVLLNPANYIDLISGCDYTYSGYSRNYKGLKYFVSFMTLYLAAPYIFTSLGKSGFHTKNVETATNAPKVDVDALKNEYFMLGQSEGNLIRQYIFENINSYQLFSDCKSGNFAGAIYISQENTGKFDINHPSKWDNF